MKEKRFKSLRLTSLLSLALICASPALVSQQIFNGEHTLSFDSYDFRPEPLYIAHGEGQDATINLNFAFLFSGEGARIADSAGSGTGNTAIFNIDPDSQLFLEFDEDGLADIVGFDGTAEINVLTEEWSNPEVINLRTRRVSLAVEPGSSATVNLVGPHSTWDARIRHIDLGIGGNGTINILEGARLFAAQRLAVGGSRWTETSGLLVDEETNEVIQEPYAPVAGGLGILNLDGAGSRIDWANSVNGWLRIGRRSTGIMTVSNGAVADLASNTLAAGLEIYVGDLPGGDGTLIIESGGVVESNSVFRINSQNSDRGYVRVDGAGSQLNILRAEDSGATSFIGNASNNPGSIGIMEIVNGGTAVFGSISGTDNKNIRIGNQGPTEELPGRATGEVTVDGAGSSLTIGNFLQVGFSGTGTMNVTNGGLLTVGLEGTSFSSVGRNASGEGNFIIDGEGSKAVFDNSLYIASGALAITSPGTGKGLVEVRNGGLLEVGNHLAARAEGTILVDGGTIRLTGTGQLSVGGSEAFLGGEGLVEANVLLGNNGSILGTGDGLQIDGTLEGSGFAGNAAITQGVISRSSTGPLVFQGVTVSPAVNVFIDGAGVQTISFDEATDFSGADLVVEFDLPVDPATDLSFALFSGPDLNFANITIPEGWILEDGVLRHESAEPPVETAFENWAASYGLAGDDALPGANPSGDGFSNAAKFAFGASPLMAVPALAEVESTAEGVTLRWNRLTAAGATYRIERSPTLEPGSWEEVEGAVPALVDDPGAEVPEGYERVEWTAVPAEGKAFYRVVSVLEPSLLP